MFRRKEDSLFDSTDIDSGAESATVIQPQASAAAAPAAAPASSASTSTQSPYSAPSASAPRPASANSGFRAGTSSLTSDLTRNRLPESKPSAPAAPSSANAEKNAKGAPRRVLTVGNDILLKGEIATCDRLVIEGKVDATLNDVHTVEISENGSFKGSAHIEDAEISGIFEGDLVVRNRLVIYSTGKVRGKISYGEIEIERGGELTGEIKTTAASAQAGVAAPRPRQSAPKDDKVAA